MELFWQSYKRQQFWEAIDKFHPINAVSIVTTEVQWSAYPYFPPLHGDDLFC